jgi:cytoskeleton protein RodZ
LEVAVKPVSEQLQCARLKKSWSQDYAAKCLHLPVSSISALEQGRYSELPGDTFIFGYIRSYASLLELSADDIVEAFKSEVQTSLDLAYVEPVMYAGKQSVKFQHQSFRTAYGLTAAVVVIVLLSVFSRDDVINPIASSGIEVDTAAGTTVIGSVEGLPDSNPTAGMLPRIHLSQPVASTEADAQLRQRILGQTSVESVAEQKSMLSFEFTADCWVEVKDGDNQVIFASLQKADKRLELSGKPPFRVTLGYAAGVQLSYNGQAVNIDAGTADAAPVKLVLGNS